MSSRLQALRGDAGQFLNQYMRPVNRTGLWIRSAGNVGKQVVLFGTLRNQRLCFFHLFFDDAEEPLVGFLFGLRFSDTMLTWNTMNSSLLPSR